MSLPQQHALNSLFDKYYSKKAKPYWLSIALFTQKQCSKIKSPIVDSNNYLNEVFPSFNRLYKELSPGFWLVNTLFSFPYSKLQGYKSQDHLLKETW